MPNFSIQLIKQENAFPSQYSTLKFLNKFQNNEDFSEKGRIIALMILLWLKDQKESKEKTLKKLMVNHYSDFY